MVANGCGNHTRKMRAAAQAAERRGHDKMNGECQEFFAPDDHDVSSVVVSNSSPQPLVLLRAGLGIEAPLLRRPRGFGGVALAWHDQRAPHEIQQFSFRDAAVLFLAARFARHDEQLAGVIETLTREARSRVLTSSGSVALRSSAKRSCTAVATLLTFCPPGPEERMKATSRSVSGISSPSLTHKLICHYLRCCGRSFSAWITRTSCCWTGIVMPCFLNSRQISRFTSERTLLTPFMGSRIQKRASTRMP